MTNLQTITSKARSNRSNRTHHTIKQNGLKFSFKFSEMAEGYEGKYLNNTFYVYHEGDLIGDLYDNQDGTFSMWVDETGILVEGLTQPMHIERAWQDGNLTENPIDATATAKPEIEKAQEEFIKIEKKLSKRVTATDSKKYGYEGALGRLIKIDDIAFKVLYAEETEAYSKEPEAYHLYDDRINWNEVLNDLKTVKERFKIK